MKYKIMSGIVVDVAENLGTIRSRINEAIKKRPSHFPQKDPILVAVSKTKTLEAIRKAYDAGQRHFGENYLKELLTKSTNPDMVRLCPDIKWHYIGMFQTKMAPSLMKVHNLHMVETLSSTSQADAVNSRWASKEPLKVFIQVNTSGEKSKSGLAPENCVEVANHVYKSCVKLNLSGLMSIGAPGHDYSNGPNPDFTLLRECRERVCQSLRLSEEELELSMGMSCDFEEAIASGSTVVRVGSSIFGARDYPNVKKEDG